MKKKVNISKSKTLPLIGIGVVVLGLVYLLGFANIRASIYESAVAHLPERFIPLPQLDIADYDQRVRALAHVTDAMLAASIASSSPPAAGLPQGSALWPPKAVYPNIGAILPFKRIIAYYGNYYSRQMGVLGEYDPDQMLAMLMEEKKQWEAADPTTPVLPALEYIAVVAQATAGKGGKYILRMPDDQIDKTIELAAKIHGIVVLEVQVGLSNVEAEVPLLEKYLKMPQVHLALDPEFSMKRGEPPGTVIGTMDAVDINFAAQYLARLVQEYNLPPKVLIVHRFTQNMVTNYQDIQPLPEVQIVLNMDGFGSKEKKRGTYSRVIYPEPIQFAGIKLFYKNDAKPPSTGVLTPAEVFSLMPTPIYIQYQ